MTLDEAAVRRLRIEVVSTDIGDLAMLGFGSIQNCRRVCEALQETCPATTLRVISSMADLEAIRASRPDLVVAGIKYVDFSRPVPVKSSDSKIWLAQFLEDSSIEYTGSQQPAIAREFDKSLAEQAVRCKGLKTANSFVVRSGQFQQADQLPQPFPLFIKPLCESDSKGIDQHSVVHNFVSFKAKVKQIEKKFNQPALAETYLPGREFTVAILSDLINGDFDLMPIEVAAARTHANEHFLAYTTKHENAESIKTIDDLSLQQHVADLALAAFSALEGRDFGRIDIKLDAAGQPCFLEANLLPGMHQLNSYFPLACSACKKMNYQQVVWQMVIPAIRRLAG